MLFDDSPQLNAMAFPGGLIILTAGLLDKVGSENELAFIIGYEMGHFKNRDHIRGMGRGVVLSILFVATSTDDGGATLSSSVADLALRGFSRRQESEADEFGLEIINQEYGHVADAWRFFERIDEGDEEFLDLMTYVSTHPSPDDRVQKLIEKAAGNGWSIDGPVTEIHW